MEVILQLDSIIIESYGKCDIVSHAVQDSVVAYKCSVPAGLILLVVFRQMHATSFFHYVHRTRRTYHRVFGTPPTNVVEKERRTVGFCIFCNYAFSLCWYLHFVSKRRTKKKDSELFVTELPSRTSHWINVGAERWGNVSELDLDVRCRAWESASRCAEGHVGASAFSDPLLFLIYLPRLRGFFCFYGKN